VHILRGLISNGKEFAKHLLPSVSICFTRKCFTVNELQMETDETDILQTFLL
jgi:hypothetical protein